LQCLLFYPLLLFLFSKPGVFFISRLTGCKKS
jgi:hypothetical protein